MKKVSATKKKVKWSEPLPKQKPLLYKEDSVVPLQDEEKDRFEDGLRAHFKKTVIPLSDDEFMLKYKHFVASKRQAAARDPLSSLDVYVLTQPLFNCEFERRGLKKPINDSQ